MRGLLARGSARAERPDLGRAGPRAGPALAAGAGTRGHRDVRAPAPVVAEAEDAGGCGGRGGGPGRGRARGQGCPPRGRPAQAHRGSAGRVPVSSRGHVRGAGPRAHRSLGYGTGAAGWGPNRPWGDPLRRVHVSGQRRARVRVPGIASLPGGEGRPGTDRYSPRVAGRSGRRVTPVLGRPRLVFGHGNGPEPRSPGRGGHPFQRGAGRTVGLDRGETACHPMCTVTESNAGGWMGACPLSVSRAMMVWVWPTFSPVVVPWKILVQLMPNMVP